ncbi:ribonuclease H-like domain-containing protein [Tanacetum coccineum]|uniref:Ribonuclease H-like domain-containing protein n=1 Tax=Tanacetum coccineum TaxID=301880 RepID=A0ABQ5G070_9ASTR
MFGVINYSHAQSAQQEYSFTPSIMWPDSDMQLYYYPQTVPLPVYMAQVPTVTAQTATLPQAFHTMTPQDPSWNMDTEASSHLTDNTSMLTSFSNSSIYPSVFVGNGNSIPVTHTGHSFLHTSHKPLHLNHILTQKLLRCDSTGDLYPVTQQPPLQTPVVLLSLSSTTWHRRLGHPGEDVLRRLESSNLISCNKSKSSALCHACQLGKHVKLPFYSSESSAKSIFEIIHSDIRTSPIPSESKIKYYAILLDHFSHFVWVYPLHKKSDLFDNCVAFRAYVNKQFNVDIKALQCDHSKSERMLRTVNNLIRTLLFQAHIPPSYWVEALNMAAHLLNTLPSTAINNEIPFAKLYNQIPTYEHLRVFGCLCYPYVDVAHKLEPRSTPCIFFGYPANHRGYRCLDLVSNKIIISRHVRFDEDIFPFRNFTKSTKPTYDFLLPPMQTITNRSLYGLKQAHRAWFQWFASFITRGGFQHSKTDTSLFVYHRGSDVAYLLLYVDDIRSKSRLFLSQSKFAEEILERVHMQHCNPCKTPVDTESKLGSDGDSVNDPTLYRNLACAL